MIPRLRHVLARTLLTGMLATSAVLVAAPHATADLPDPVSPYRVLQGVELKAKPPPWVLPVAGYHLTGRYGASSGLWASTHTGLDFAAPEGTELRAIGPGVVTSASSDGAFGNKTVIRLDDGTVLWYCHQSAFAAKPGQRLEPGDLVGYVGSTGNVTGPHLHLEVHRKGAGAVDPESWLPSHGLHA
jgi:murein DD-endopeptidase MepM/ murein hydrolase activator NlpD